MGKSKRVNSSQSQKIDEMYQLFKWVKLGMVGTGVLILLIILVKFTSM